MKTQTFNEKVKEHLSKLEVKKELGFTKEPKKIPCLNEKGKYRNETYGYILSDSFLGDLKDPRHSKYSYIENYREEIIDRIEGDNIKLHMYQKHLNSSQSMAINFFYPIKIEGVENSFYSDTFGLIAKNLEITLEKSMDDSGGGVSQTEVDCLIETKGIKHLFEIKYTENTFGNVKDEAKYRAKWEGTKDKTSRLNLTKGKKVQYNKVSELFEDIDYEFYLKNYQLVRNLYNTFFECRDGLIHRRSEVGSMNCIFSNRNDTQLKEFLHFKNKLKLEYQDKVNFYSWETLVNKMIDYSKINGNEKLKRHYEKFRSIYLDF